jgi:hypothetical protein
MVDVAYFSAFAALTGSTLGGLTSLATAWFIHRAQVTTEHRERDKSRRQKLYREFVEEASQLYGDALVHEQSEVTALVGIYAKISRMRVVSSAPVIEAAEKVAHTIVETYLGPNRTLAELGTLINSDLDPLKGFSEACRQELQSQGYL